MRRLHLQDPESTQTWANKREARTSALKPLKPGPNALEAGSD